MHVCSSVELLDYQSEGVELISEYGGRVLLADEMGLGKTVQALVAVARNPDWQPVLVVCPASVKYHWARETLKFTGVRPRICEGQKPPDVQDFLWHLPAVVVINYDILDYWVPLLKKVKFQTVVFDECQSLQNPKAKRTKAARKLCRSVSQILGLSGTPLNNRPRELWSILNLLWPSEFPNLSSYQMSYCGPRLRPWGWDYNGSSNLKELNQRLVSLGMVRRRKADVLKSLPPKTRRMLPLDLTDREEYKQASTDFLGWMKKTHPEKEKKAKKAEQVVKVGYLIRLAARLKMKAAVEWINQFLIETDEKIILFGVHKKALDVLQRRVKGKSVRVDGGVTGKHRQAAVDQFQMDEKTRVFIGNIKAAGVGLNLTAASTVGFVELGWRPADLLQAENRPHRVGQINPVTVWYLVAGGTIEEKLCKLHQKKQTTIDSILDGEAVVDSFDLYDELIAELEKKVQS